VELLIDRVIVRDEEIEIRYVVPTSPEGPHLSFCHLRTDYLDGLPRRELIRQESPSTATLEDVKDSVEDLADGVDPRSSSLVGRRNVGLDAFPFGVGQIGQVAPFHAQERTLSFPPDPIFQTVSGGGVLGSSA